jgi:hypothetical protein
MARVCRKLKWSCHGVCKHMKVDERQKVFSKKKKVLGMTNRLLSWVWIIYYDRRSVGHLSWNKAPIWDLYDQIFLLSDSGGFVDAGRSLWREDGSVVYNCCHCSHSRIRVLWDSRNHILLSQILDFAFRRLLQLAGLRWRYSTPTLHGLPTFPSLHNE